MFKNLKAFISRLQNSDEATKKRWLIVVSAITMIFVISGWMVYLNYTIEKINSIEDEIIHSTSFWQVFKTGLVITGKSIKEKTGNLVSDIRSMIRSKNTIIIER